MKVCLMKGGFVKLLTSDLTQKITDFVKARRHESGGYSATPMLSVTVEDTYHALRIISTLPYSALRPQLGESALKGYLKARAANIAEVGMRTVFQMLAACQMTGADKDELYDAQEMKSLVEIHQKKAYHIQERYYGARIRNEIFQDSNAQFHFDDIAANHGRYTSELWMILYQSNLRAKNAIRLKRKGLIGWLKACQNHDGGFGFLPGSTSYIENCHTCLRALNLLQARPDALSACKDFVLACMTGTGGFARINGATAFLDSTWHAVASLAILETMQV